MEIGELAGGASVRGHYLVAKNQEGSEGLVGHGMVILVVLRREGGEGTQHGVMLQGIITLL